MPDQVPSPEGLREIGLRALAYIRACRRLEDANRRLEGGEDLPSAERSRLIDDRWVAIEAQAVAKTRLESSLNESGGMAPYGWPESVSATLGKIALMLRLGYGYVDYALGGIDGFEREIESLVTARDGPGGDDQFIPFADALSITDLTRPELSHASRQGGPVRSKGKRKGKLVHKWDAIVYALGVFRRRAARRK
jgi:hypothetical protein